LVLVAYAVYVVETIAGLPDCVATHFGASGAANGWMSRDAYRTFMLISGPVTAFFPLLVGLAMRSAPARFINLPHRDYWLAPERRDATFAWLRGHMSWLCILLLLFVSVIHWTVVVANRRTPPWLDPRGAVGIVVVLMAAMLVWIGVMLVHFSRKRT